ncbi:hypothetical protein [Burkholderia cenocepacia]|uniref:hypothetical protein n=1 Tax=Burkholderia cenocepacia TaxID=95486 RepID=UPI001C22C57C|nr:hypothetical protein [Burkholderia cenocepacia]MBU9658422.1 hypothetical protein [Burkholderia cenocepacia]
MKTTSAYKKRAISVQNVLALGTIAVALAACGGGDGSSSASTSGGSTTTTPQQDAVSQSSTALVAQTGATAVPGTNSTTQAFDLTADIGDTWRLALNQDGTFSIKVLSTQYGLTDISGTYTQSTSGSFTSYTGTSPNGSFSLRLDTRTKTIIGQATLGTRSSSVAGTGYSVPSNTMTLAGDYFFLGATRNASDGNSSSTVAGTFRLAANGTDITLCDSGLINSLGKCDTPNGSSTTPTQVALKLVPNATDGLMHVQVNDGTTAAPVWNDFGILSFQAGDRGPVLTIDRFGNNQATPPAMRTGAIYASKLQMLAQTVVNGFLACQDSGTPFANLQINGPQVLLADSNGNYQPYAQLFYNNISTGKGLYEVDGVATMVVGNQFVGSGALFLPLSSSLTVFERDATQTVAVCR